MTERHVSHEVVSAARRNAEQRRSTTGPLTETPAVGPSNTDATDASSVSYLSSESYNVEVPIAFIDCTETGIGDCSHAEVVRPQRQNWMDPNRSNR